MTVGSHGAIGLSPTVPDIPRVTGGRSAVPSRRGGGGGWSRWALRTCWLWPALATAGLGSYQIARPELWRDELASWFFASLSLPRLLATAQVTDGAQAPYYLVLHYWMEVFGSSVPAMRALSVLAMAGAAAFVALAARDLAGPGTGTAAGLVFALVPSVSRFAQEVRFYALAACFAALATWLLVRALDRPSWARWAGYAAAMAAAGWFDTVSMSLLAGHGAWAALRWYGEHREHRDRGSGRRNPGLFRFAVAAAASVAACVPLILLGSQQAASQLVWLKRPDLGAAEWAAFGASLFYSGRVAVAVLIVAALAAAARPRIAAYLLPAALLPVAAVWLVSQGSVSYFFPRYVLFTLVPLSILAGAAVTRPGRVAAVAALMALAVLGAPDQGMIRQPAAHNWPAYPSGSGAVLFEYGQAARIIAAGARPGDGIAYSEGTTAWEVLDLGVGYYLNQDGGPGAPAPRELFAARTPAQAHGLYPVPCADPARCLGQPGRVWIVGGWPSPNPLWVIPRAESAALRHAGYRVSRLWHTGGLTVGLLTRSPRSR